MGFVADRVLGDPARWHPVAGFGRGVSAVERRCYQPTRRRGTAFTAGVVTATGVAGWTVERLVRRRPALRVAATAVATWAVLGGASLLREASALAGQLAVEDLAAAREQVTHLVGRDPSRLDAAGIARATVESLAENTSDAVVAPLWWGAVAGVPGLLTYRAINTLDAMVGHRSERYVRFGWASARLDDVVNLVPARLTAALVALAAPVVGGRPRTVLRVVRRDAGQHPSPNAGPVEAAVAGALDVTLGGVNVYHGVAEDRGALGDGPEPAVPDIARTRRLVSVVSAAAAMVGAAIAVSAGHAGTPRRRRRRPS
nr:cobalamin biosynthesis protein [Nakamurella leprariae]